MTGKKEQTRRAIVDRIGKIEEIRTATLTPEKKAEIDKARSKVKELADALRAKQKELAEAQAKLSKLQADTHVGVNVIKVDPLDSQLQRQVIRLRDLSAKPATPSGSRYSDNRDADSDKKRLEELEKKLEKLLDDVASLKKDRTK